MEVLKCIKGTGPPCLTALFDVKQSAYSFRNPVKLIQGRTKTSSFGLRSLSYLGAKIWNDIPFSVGDIEDIDVYQFKNMLKSRQYPNIENLSYKYFV